MTINLCHRIQYDWKLSPTVVILLAKLMILFSYTITFLCNTLITDEAKMKNSVIFNKEIDAVFKVAQSKYFTLPSLCIFYIRSILFSKFTVYASIFVAIT